MINKSTLDPKAVYEALENPDTYATVLFTICLIMYGDEIYNVDPLTICTWLEEDFVAKIHEDNENKLKALLIALTTNYFYTDVETFTSVCKTLTTGDPGIYTPYLEDNNITGYEIVWGIYEVSLITDDDITANEEFTPAIKVFIDYSLKDEVFDVEDGTIPNFIANNVQEITSQLVAIGIKDLPDFPVFELDI